MRSFIMINTDDLDSLKVALNTRVHGMCETAPIDAGERLMNVINKFTSGGMDTSDENAALPVVTASYFDKIQKGFKKLQEDCTEVRLVGFCQKEDIPDEAYREEFEEEFDHEYQLIQSDGYDEASFWGDIYLQLNGMLYMRFDVIG